MRLESILSKGILLLIFVASIALAETPAVPEQARVKIEQTLAELGEKFGRPVVASAVNPTPIPDLYEVVSDASIIYVSADAKYLLSGELIDLSKQPQNWSLTEQSLRKIRLALLEEIAAEELIKYPAKGKSKATAYVFTDIDCVYCRKMHEQLSQYTDAGININYLAYPRAGVDSKSYDKAVSVWCDADRTAALDNAKLRQEVDYKTCQNNPVKKHFELARRLGIYGTPTMVLDNGSLLVGFVPAARVLEASR